MKLPRRLAHAEPAELVDHLGELRARLFVSVGALTAGFAVGYAFHARLIGFLNEALPAGRRHPVTLGVTEPFMTSIKVSLYAGFALALPVLLWQAWSFFAPAVGGRNPTRDGVVRSGRDGVVRGRGRVRVPPRPARRRCTS